MTSRMASLAAMIMGGDKKDDSPEKKTRSKKKPAPENQPEKQAMAEKQEPETPAAAPDIVVTATPGPDIPSQRVGRALRKAKPGAIVDLASGETVQAAPRQPQPYERYEIGPHVLYRGDARDVIAGENLKCNMLLFDAPYKLTSGGKSGLMRGAFDPAEYNNNGNLVEGTDEAEDGITWPEIMATVFPTLERGHCYSFCNDKNLRDMLNAAHEAGFDFHNMLSWDKRTAVANRWYMKNTEFVGFFYTGKARAIRDKGAKQTVICPQVDVSGHFNPLKTASGGRKNHPTEKPALLMQFYIENSTFSPEDVVLDPFAGSGSTGVGAVYAGVKFIGIEKSQEWFGVMKARLEDAMNKKAAGGKIEYYKPEQIPMQGLEIAHESESASNEVEGISGGGDRGNTPEV